MIDANDTVLPAGSAAHVARIGALSVAAEQLVARLGRRSPVSLPIEVGTAANGLLRLVNKDTGESLGMCATPAVAENTRKFFANEP